MNRYRRYTVRWVPVGFVIFVLFVNLLDWYPSDLLRWLWIFLLSVGLWQTYGRSLGIVSICGDEEALSVGFGLTRPDIIRIKDIAAFGEVRYSGRSGWYKTPSGVPFGAFRQVGVELSVANDQTSETYRIPTRDARGLCEYLKRSTKIDMSGF